MTRTACKPTTVTRTIGGHTFTLTVGRRYQASRPFASRGVRRFDVKISDITNGISLNAAPVATVPGLSYDDANALLAAFNDGETSFDGRVW